MNIRFVPRRKENEARPLGLFARGPAAVGLFILLSSMVLAHGAHAHERSSPDSGEHRRARVTCGDMAGWRGHVLEIAPQVFADPSFLQRTGSATQWVAWQLWVWDSTRNRWTNVTEQINGQQWYREEVRQRRANVFIIGGEKVIRLPSSGFYYVWQNTYWYDPDRGWYGFDGAFTLTYTVVDRWTLQGSDQSYCDVY